MNDVSPVSSPSPKKSSLRTWILTLALLTSPALCCGGFQLLDALPSSWLPGSLDFTVNLFESTALIENQTTETLYVTAVTTTYGAPRVIPQNIAFRQRDIPVVAQGLVTLTYDSADLPLSGIVACRSSDECRLLPSKNFGTYELTSFEALETLEPNWKEAVQAQPLYNYGTVGLVIFSVVPLLLFLSWVYLTVRARQALCK